VISAEPVFCEPTRVLGHRKGTNSVVNKQEEEMEREWYREMTG
jgi:hypothetical protein